MLSAMNRWLAIGFLAAACGAPTPNNPHVSRTPISVRGWIVDIESPPNAYHTIETEWARKRQLFQQTNVWVDNASLATAGEFSNVPAEFQTIAADFDQYYATETAAFGPAFGAEASLLSWE